MSDHQYIVADADPLAASQMLETICKNNTLPAPVKQFAESKSHLGLQVGLARRQQELIASMQGDSFSISTLQSTQEKACLLYRISSFLLQKMPMAIRSSDLKMTIGLDSFKFSI